MDWVNTNRNIMETIRKYRYVVIVLLVGLFLMLIPIGEGEAEAAPVQIQQKEEEDLQSQLEELLSHMEGAGKVKVLLTQSAGERRIYQTNDSSDTSERESSVRKDTVMVTDAGRSETGLLQQTLPPVYLGAVILCQGADSAKVRLAVIEAVSSATGLASHNISVLKMK